MVKMHCVEGDRRDHGEDFRMQALSVLFPGGLSIP